MSFKESIQETGQIPRLEDFPSYCGLAAAIYQDMANTIWPLRTDDISSKPVEAAILNSVRRRLEKIFNDRAEALKRIAEDAY